MVHYSNPCLRPQEVYSGVLDVSKGQSLLTVIHEYLKLVMLPALAGCQKWGDVSLKQRNRFNSNLNGFLSFLASAYWICMHL